VLLCGAAVIAVDRIRGAGSAGAPSPARAPAAPAPSSAQPSPSPTGCRWLPTASDQPDQKSVGTPPASGEPRSGTALMTITTNLGVIEIAIDRAKTPCTAASFTYLASQHFFDGTACHRLTTKQIFVVQCGDPVGNGRGGPGYRFADENLPSAPSPLQVPIPTAWPSGLQWMSPEALPDGLMSECHRLTGPPDLLPSGGKVRFCPDQLPEPPEYGYPRAVVAMADNGTDSDNGSQFFINYGGNLLGGRYTPFGVVVKGMEIIDQVAAGGVMDGTSEGRPRIRLEVRSLTVH
jgi:peptidyl-prolyl cis-trans isomerase B (cyclophilin B)